MRYFKLIKSGVDIQSLMREVELNEWAWQVSTTRQEIVTVQREAQIIHIRSMIKRNDVDGDDNQVEDWTKTSDSFPLASKLMFDFAKSVNGTLSRAGIVRLKPKGKVYPHIDRGTYYFIRDRYHLVLKSPLGSLLTSGNETVRMQEGELWWFDNKEYHSALNESDEWRVHYIFDVLPHQLSSLAKNPL